MYYHLFTQTFTNDATSTALTNFLDIKHKFKHLRGRLNIAWYYLGPSGKECDWTDDFKSSAEAEILKSSVRLKEPNMVFSWTVRPKTNITKLLPNFQNFYPTAWPEVNFYQPEP